MRCALREDDVFVFCDCGLKHMEALGVKPDLIVGDFDSHDNPHMEAETIVLPRAKDDTDTDADVHTSAVTGEGIAKLKELLYEKGLGARSEDAAFLIEERHFNALNRAKESLASAVLACERFDPLDFIGIEVQSAWEILGEITGETASEAVIEEIFMKFCVGK